jgi:hypothetical protein
VIVNVSDPLSFLVISPFSLPLGYSRCCRENSYAGRASSLQIDVRGESLKSPNPAGGIEPHNKEIATAIMTGNKIRAAV